MSAFSMALRDITSLCGRIQTTVAAPAAAQQPALVFAKNMQASEKAMLPASVVIMKDGTYRATPWQKAATFGATAKLLGTVDGKLVPPAQELDVSGIQAIALGCLSVQEKADFTPPVGQLTSGWPADVRWPPYEAVSSGWATFHTAAGRPRGLDASRKTDR